MQCFPAVLLGEWWLLLELGSAQSLDGHRLLQGSPICPPPAQFCNVAHGVRVLTLCTLMCQAFQLPAWTFSPWAFRMCGSVLEHAKLFVLFLYREIMISQKYFEKIFS